MGKIKVTPAQLKALISHLDGRQTWANPVTVIIDGDKLRLHVHRTGEIMEVVGIIPTS